ncbi:MAG: ABC transporter ATP-binding protein/permease [Chloroflexi bacterium]|nr:ABC transporter ATP-binding protein/permease [Chloroflexota bacterium]
MSVSPASITASRRARFARFITEHRAHLGDAALNIRRAFAIVLQAHRPSAFAMAACTVVGALLPAGQAWVGKLIVDTVVAAMNSNSGAQAGLMAALPLLAAEFVLLVSQAGVNQARTFAEHVLHARLNLDVNTRIIRKALDLDLTYFENPEYYDKLQNARREADWRGLQIVNGGFYLIQNVITLASFGALLLRFSPLLAVVLFAATIPTFIAQSKYAELNFRVLSWRAPEARRLSYLEYLLTDYDSVKEVRLFGLGDPLLARYAKLFWTFLKQDQAIAQRRSIASFAWGMLATLSYYVSYAWIVWSAVGNLITLGDMTLYLGIFRGSQSTFEAIFNGLSELYENALFMSNLFTFLDLKPQMVPPAAPVPVPVAIRHGIELRGVSFRYEGQEEWALRDVNLTINPGETIALVGPNGAGKTTLIKLLTRLYDPTEGQILLDGVDLREYDLRELRQMIGVIFQDYVRYHLAARENVGFGQIEALDDRLRIVRAAEKSGASRVIESLPQGYDTTLGRWFSDGRDLSGGEWQKIALARAFMRDCRVLVLDEPTAALDAENELQVFGQFRELAAGKVAILISHRFSTVRMADRIFVVEHGRISEEGTHGALLALGGTYARLFTLQAESYR